MLLFCTISSPSSGAEERHYKGAWPPVRTPPFQLFYCYFSLSLRPPVILSFVVFTLFSCFSQLVYPDVKMTKPWNNAHVCQIAMLADRSEGNRDPAGMAWRDAL